MGIAERAGVWRMWRQSSKPSVPGNITSSRNKLGISRRASEMTEAPLIKLCTLESAGPQIVRDEARNVGIILHHENEETGRAGDTGGMGSAHKNPRGVAFCAGNYAGSLRETSSIQTLTRLYGGNVARMCTAVLKNDEFVRGSGQ